MPPEDSAAETTNAAARVAIADAPPAIAAPRREKRLVPVATKSRRPPAAAVRVPTQRPANRPMQVPTIESKLAALQDPNEMLNVVRTEAALRRAQRLSGQGDAQRQMIRVLSVCMLFALLAAAIGAMWYLQGSLQGSRRVRRPPAAASVGTTTPADRPAPAAR